MANPEHLAILEQGVEAWNQWRSDNPETYPNLREAALDLANLSMANLSGSDLSRANLSGAILSRVNLFEAELRGAHLSGANLIEANLIGADLSRAHFIGADLTGADLSKACLVGANLIAANFSRADLSETNLSKAYLGMAKLIGTDLGFADLSGARLSWTTFGNVDLSQVEGLHRIVHEGPSTIGIDTIHKSAGNIPEVFLQGAGVPDRFITYINSLVGKPIEYYSAFISHSSNDEGFANRLLINLRSNNVRTWFAPEDLKIGDKFRQSIDDSIRLYDKLLIVLSEYSVTSDWVEYEVEAALDKETEKGGDVLFPVRIDDAIMQSKKGWAAHIRRTRHIGDFTRWKDHDAYQEAFQRLLRDLKAADGDEAE